MAKAYQIAFDGNAADENFYGDIVSLTVEQNTATASTFHLQLASRHQDDGSWTYVEDDRLALFTKVKIKVGFTGGGGLAGALGGVLGGGGDDGLPPVFEGYITTVDLTQG